MSELLLGIGHFEKLLYPLSQRQQLFAKSLINSEKLPSFV